MTEHQRRKRDIISRMYLGEEMSAREIAEIVGVKVSGMRLYLQRHGIVRKSRTKRSNVNESNNRQG